jgi:hypothetical protein
MGNQTVYNLLNTFMQTDVISELSNKHIPHLSTQRGHSFKSPLDVESLVVTHTLWCSRKAKVKVYRKANRGECWLAFANRF